MKNYHAHVYFHLPDLDLAVLLFQKLQSQKGICRPWKIYERSVGPHPLPMIELHFSEATQTEVLDWLRVNIGSWSALIHEDTGNDYQDHTSGALWLGEPLPLDFTFFELIQRDPSQILHQN